MSYSLNLLMVLPELVLSLGAIALMLAHHYRLSPP